MRCFLALLLVALCSCLAKPVAEPESNAAQDLVDRIVAEHPEIVRLTIHAVPANASTSRIVACNLPEKLGQPSDPEDLEAMSSGNAIALMEGDNLDLTAPILDREGKAIAATGITLAPMPGVTDEDRLARALDIARVLTEAVEAAEKPLW